MDGSNTSIVIPSNYLKPTSAESKPQESSAEFNSCPTMQGSVMPTPVEEAPDAAQSDEVAPKNQREAVSPGFGVVFE
jgi:hypothetical protein